MTIGECRFPPDQASAIEFERELLRHVSVVLADDVNQIARFRFDGAELSGTYPRTRLLVRWHRDDDPAIMFEAWQSVWEALAWEVMHGRFSAERATQEPAALASDICFQVLDDLGPPVDNYTDRADAPDDEGVRRVPITLVW
jgi:hypothetical protein